MPQPIDEKSDTLDIASIVDKYYDKKGSLGAAQLGLAGQILKAGFQPKKDAMGTVGDAMGQFGKDISADKKAFEKLAATGEIQRELYRMSRAEEGKQDRATKAYGAELDEWLKKNGVKEDEISDIKKYNNTLFNFKQKNQTMTGHDHKNLIAGNDPEFAADTIVMEEVITGVGDKKEIKFSEYDLQQFNEADEGQVIIIGGKMFVKDSSIAGGPNNPPKMRPADYTQLKIKSPPKKKKKDKLLSDAGL